MVLFCLSCEEVLSLIVPALPPVTAPISKWGYTRRSFCNCLYGVVSGNLHTLNHVRPLIDLTHPSVEAEVKTWMNLIHSLPQEHQPKDIPEAIILGKEKIPSRGDKPHPSVRSKLDMTKGYYQVPSSPSSIP